MSRLGGSASTETAYVVAGAHAWSRCAFEEVICKYPGVWRFVGRPEELDVGMLDSLRPRYIFFLHWSWKVPRDITERFECVCFHMTDVPYGRGGSPLQNLILRGHRHTKLAALRMVEWLDAGPVYLKEDLCLEGDAEEIYLRASYLAARMIGVIITTHPEPKPQTGEPALFRRRKPAESRLPAARSLQELHDFIRMLDAEGYPRAFFEWNGFRFELSRASLRAGRILADVTITQAGDDAS